MITLLALIVLASANHTFSVQDKVVDKLVDRGLEVGLLRNANLDNTMLWKPGHLRSHLPTNAKNIRYIRPRMGALDANMGAKSIGYTRPGLSALHANIEGTMFVPPTLSSVSSDSQGQQPEGIYGDASSSLVRRVALEGRIPELTPEHWYRPPWFLRNADIHTMVASKLRPEEPPAWIDGAFAYDRSELETPDGGCVTVDMVRAAPVDSTRLLVLTSGLGGGSNDFYMKALAASAVESGWHVAVVNMRGCANSPVTSPRFFSAHRGSIDDLELALTWLRPKVATIASCASASLTVAIIGWSNGGSIVNNFAARQAKTIAADPTSMRLADAVVSLAAPLDMITANQYIERPFQSLYDRSIASNLVSMMERTLPLFGDGVVPDWKNNPVQVDIEGVTRARSIREIDEAITRRVFGFASVYDYYREASSNQRIPDIDVPLLLVNAIDDPISSPNLPYEDVRKNPNAVFVATQYGGHLGWTDENGGFSNSHEWLHGVVLGFLREALPEDDAKKVTKAAAAAGAPAAAAAAAAAA